MKVQHEKYMNRCLELALEVKANGHTPVGAVVVKNDQIIAEGFEGEQDVPLPIAHAEIIAVIRAIKYRGTKDLSHCVLYTTKEPCLMCSYLIRQTAIKGVVFATSAGETGGVHSVFGVLTSNAVKKWPSPPFVVEGVLKEACERILKNE